MGAIVVFPVYVAVAALLWVMAVVSPIAAVVLPALMATGIPPPAWAILLPIVIPTVGMAVSIPTALRAAREAA